MRVVVYADDFEPITVIKLDTWAVDFCRKEYRIHMYVDSPMDFTHPPAPMPALREITSRIVSLEVIWFHRSRNARDTGMILMASDHEGALLLKSVLLPGQMREVQERERVAFSNGALHIIDKLMRGTG